MFIKGRGMFRESVLSKENSKVRDIEVRIIFSCLCYSRESSGVGRGWSIVKENYKI